MAAQAQRGVGFDLALESINAAIALDENFALAWATKSALHDSRAQNTSLERYEEEDEALVQSAIRAIEIAPDLAEAQAAFAFAIGRRGRWSEAESAYRQVVTSTNASAVAFQYAVHSLAAGNFERALEFFDLGRRHDPLNQTTRGLHLLALSLARNIEEADAEFSRASTVFGEGWFGNWFMAMARLGATGYSSPELIPVFSPIHNEAREYLLSPEDGITALRKDYADNETMSTGDLLQYAIWGAYFGDPEFALDIMEELARRNAYNAFSFWGPAMRDVRREPRFEEIIEEIGLVDYWNEFGWPVLCRPLDGDDFECS